MGSLLEVSKLVVASWMYRNWKEIPFLMKTYFTSALIILMLLTSMGIFGFLSKAHLDQAVPSGDIAAKLSLIDERIKTEKENINANRKELSHLDSQLDQTIARTTEQSGTERAINLRRGQKKERNRIFTEIGAAQTKIAKYNEERAPIASEVRKVEAEVGPIKYIAALLYDDAADEAVLEKAVRFVIIMIVIVFDPLAVLLLVAANWNLMHNKKKDEPVYVTEIPPTVFKKPDVYPEESKNVIKEFFTAKTSSHVEELGCSTDYDHTTKKFIHLDTEVSVDDSIKITVNPKDRDIFGDAPPSNPFKFNDLKR